MTRHPVNDRAAVARAREIAKNVFEGKLDHLLACRELNDLRSKLAIVPNETFDTFIAVASEVDDLPLATERSNWASDALEVKDAEARDYRTRTKDVVQSALERMMAALEEVE